MDINRDDIHISLYNFRLIFRKNDETTVNLGDYIKIYYKHIYVAYLYASDLSGNLYDLYKPYNADNNIILIEIIKTKLIEGSLNVHLTIVKDEETKK